MSDEPLNSATRTLLWFNFIAFAIPVTPSIPGACLLSRRTSTHEPGAIMSSGTLYYDINVTRQARVADPADLVEPVEKLVRALQPEDPALALRGAARRTKCSRFWRATRASSPTS